MEIITKEITGSTNDDIDALAQSGCPSLTTVVAKYQTMGRGRRGKKWEAPPGNNLLFSTLLRPSVSPALWSRIPQVVGMLMIETVENHFSRDEGIKMKWPNDLYYYDKKWSGILVELKTGPVSYVILGMGVNCLGNCRDYPAELRGSITTLAEMFRSNQIDPMLLLESFLTRLSSQLEELLLDFARVVEFANCRDYLFGKEVTILEEGTKVTGTASGIGPHGELLTMNGDGQIRRIFGGTILEMDQIVLVKF